MLKKIIEPVIKCPSNCKCSIAIKKIYEDLKIKVIPLNIQKEEQTEKINAAFKSICQEEIKEREEYIKSIDRRERCD